jgi:MarR family transcriptional regulator for hemolysin
MRPLNRPIGLQLAHAAKVVRRAYDDALAAAGGSLPAWLILLSVKTRSPATQNELAEAVGIRAATLTHHLNAMDADGLVIRRRDPTNRRIQHVELTEAGEAAFQRMRRATVAFDQRLRAGLSDSDLALAGRVLDRLRANVADEQATRSRGRPPAARGPRSQPQDGAAQSPARRQKQRTRR